MCCICSKMFCISGVYSLYSRLCHLSSSKTKPTKCVPSEDPDQPVHLPSLLRVFAVHMKTALALSYPWSAQQRLLSDWVDAQADVSLHLVHRSVCWFYHMVAPFIFRKLRVNQYILTKVHDTSVNNYYDITRLLYMAYLYFFPYISS